MPVLEAGEAAEGVAVSKESRRVRRSGQSWSLAQRLLALLSIMILAFAAVGCAGSGGSGGDEPAAGAAEQTDSGREGSRPLEPRYQPREPQPKPWYNSDYLFGMTRGVTGSTIHPGAQVPLLVLTIPLDIVFLPFAAIGGLFG